MLIFVAALLISNASAATPSPKAARPAAPPIQAKASVAVSLPPLLREVEAKYSQAQTLTADFTETSQVAALKQTKKSSGSLQFKRPGKVHWETKTPDKNLLIGDGKKFWYYTPPFDPTDSGQYMEKDASKVQTKLAQVLLSASFSSDAAMRAMQIKQVSPTEFALIPRKGTAGSVREARIKIDPAQKLITEVDLTHRGGNKSQIVLSKIELGKPLDESLFHFTPPPNTEKIDQ